MTVVSVIVGRVTQSAARFVGKVAPADTSVSLLVSTDPTLANATEYGPATPGVDDVFDIDVTALVPATAYFYVPKVDGVVDSAHGGKFRTHPPLGQPASFTFWTAGDAGGLTEQATVGSPLHPDRVSNHTVFDTIRTHPLSPLFGIHLGDMHYYDAGLISGDEVADYRRAYDDVLAQPRQAALYRNVPLVYVWDDHDYGSDNSDNTHPGRENAAQVYRERFPSYFLPDPGAGAVYQSFQVGRVLFVITDPRYHRDPDDNPDGPGHTMLGGQQKAWLQSVLSTSTAEALVFVTGVQWIGLETEGILGSDSWSGFVTERAELAQMFADTGWADRMIIINADAHKLAFDSGTNSVGGAPVYVCAALDANPSLGTTGYDVGSFGASNQYAMVTVTDDGNMITLGTTGYRGTVPLISHSVQIDTSATAPPPTQEPELAVGIESPVITWLACDLVTGRIIATLPEVRGEVSRLLCAYTSTQLTMPIPLSGPGAMGGLAFEATTPGRTMIIAVVNDEPAWAGIVLTRRGGSGPEMLLGCASLEAYLLRRRVRDHEWNDTDEATIAAGLVDDAEDLLLPNGTTGHGLGFLVDAPLTGTKRDRTYLATDRATVYERLRELSGVEGGPEWTVELVWADETHTRVDKVFRVRKRIGIASAQPASVFETTAGSVFASQSGSEATYTFTEDFSEARGANYVVAYGTGEGDDQPSSDPAVDDAAIAAGWPIFEHHFQPGSSITTKSVLDEHAVRDLSLRHNGALIWELTARWNVTPRLNIDWRLGDDVAWVLAGHRHPARITGQGRCIGWTLDAENGLASPILLDADEGVVT